MPRRLLVPFVLVSILLASLLVASAPASAASVVRINTGGSAQNVDGTAWTGCTSLSNCNGYVSGGFPWSENPASIAGVVSPDSQTIEKSEWSGGSTSGVAWGATAFTFNIPASGSDSYDVKLHFTENNKWATGQRVFDVKINGAIVLSNFDIYQQAGGANRAIVRSFAATPVNSNISIAFLRKTENAKISAIEVIGSDSTTSTTGTTSSSTSSTSTTVTPTTSTTTAPTGRLSWSSISSTPLAGLEATSGVVGNKMYTFGGYFNNVWVPTNRAYSYDPVADRWSSLPSVPKNLTHSATVVNGNQLIIAGGYSTNSSGAQIYGINNVWSFDPSTGIYSSLPNLPAARGSGGLAKVGGKLHYFGGVDTSRKEQSTHWVLDLNNLSAGWQTTSPVPFNRTHFAVRTIDDSVYVVGGLTGIDSSSTEYNTVFKMDGTTESWTTMASAPTVISHMADSSVLYGGKIWVFGGEPRHGQTLNTVYVFDPATNSWSTNTSMPSSRLAGNTANIGGTFYFGFGSMTATGAFKAS